MPLASLSSLIKCFWVRLEPTQAKHLSVVPLLSKLLALVPRTFPERNNPECKNPKRKNPERKNPNLGTFNT